MADNDDNKAGAKGWTDRQRVRHLIFLPAHQPLTHTQLAYFVSLVEFSKVKLDYNVGHPPSFPTVTNTRTQNAPRPEGKSVGACQIMVHRLKGTLKTELEALKNGNAMPEESSTPKKAATPRKRKVKDVDGGEEATPAKKGHKKKEVVPEPEPEVEDDEDMMTIKGEPEFGDES